MKKIITSETTIVIIGIAGLLLAGSDAEPHIFPLNVLAGAVLLALAGLLCMFSRPVPRR